jgi:phosphoglycerate-specific signal transduction histidine kinase
LPISGIASLLAGLSAAQCSWGRRPEMNGEDRTKIQNIVRRLRAILDELRELEKTSQDTSVKQMAISAALALAWVELVENFRTKEDNGE